MEKRTYFNGRFEQRTRSLVTTAQGLPSNKIPAVAYDKKGTLFAGTSKGLAKIEDGKASLIKLKTAKDGGEVSMLFTDSKGRLWAGSGCELFCINGKKAAVFPAFNKPVADMKESPDGTLWLLTEDYLYKKTEDGSGFERHIDVPGIASSLAVSDDNAIFAGTKKSGLLGLIGKRPHWAELFKEFTGLISNNVNCVAFDSVGYVWVGTDKGVCVYDGKGHWLSAREVPELPRGCINAMTFTPDGNKWFATSTGLVLLKDGKLKYLGFQRWVPSPAVLSVAASPSGTVCAGTDEGLSIIETALMTLEEKAAHYQKTVEKYHVRHGGYVTIRLLDVPGDIESGHVEVSDNDGTWTSMYMASQCYRYGVTKEKDALEKARRGFGALKQLAYITGIPGFTARAVRYPDDPGAGFGNGDPEWHLDADGECEWKGETSSDEMVGNFYGFSAYYDIVANDKEKAEIADIIRAIMDHILANNFKLVDTDGLPTTWANWAPEDLNHNDHWHAERGQNALELLSMLKTACHMTGDEKYNKVYLRMIKDHHYLMNTMHYKLEDYHSCHIDDELGMLTITPLLKYEKDPVIRSYLLLGLTHHWEYERVERSPLWSVIYGALTGRHCDIELAAKSLEELPLDLIHWPTYNSHRDDLEWITASEEFWMPPQLKEPLPYDEKPMNKYDASPFNADSGIKLVTKTDADGNETTAIEISSSPHLNGRRAEDGTVFLHPYWMGRYYGLLGD